MTGPQFHETRSGHRFLNHTMPRLVEELERLNGVLERLAATLEAGQEGESGKPPARPRRGDTE